MTKQKNGINKKKHTKLLQQKRNKKAREQELTKVKRKAIVLTMQEKSEPLDLNDV